MEFGTECILPEKMRKRILALKFCCVLGIEITISLQFG
jgi:hypothetical protein